MTRIVRRTSPLVAFRDVSRTYALPAGPFHALRQVSLEIERGDFVCVVGQSGSGKSTLLSLLAGIDRPTSGEVQINDVAIHALSEQALSTWRSRAVGIVFQFFQLLPTLTVAENVMLPMDFGRTWPRHERRDRAMRLLERLGVADQANKLPSRLSGGQQQRVAVARALANEPPLLLADEPTGNLDSANAASLLALLGELVADGLTVVMVTHEHAAMQHASRTLTLRDGRLLADAEAARA